MVHDFYSIHNNLCISQAISFYKVNEFKTIVVKRKEATHYCRYFFSKKLINQIKHNETLNSKLHDKYTARKKE